MPWLRRIQNRRLHRQFRDFARPLLKQVAQVVHARLPRLVGNDEMVNAALRL